MPIDNCTHTFGELASSVLPNHFSRLEEAIRSPIPAEQLVRLQDRYERYSRTSLTISRFPGLLRVPRRGEASLRWYLPYGINEAGSTFELRFAFLCDSRVSDGIEGLSARNETRPGDEG